MEREPPEGSVILSERAKFYQYFTLNGRRVTPVTRTKRHSAGLSIVYASWGGSTYAGEVVAVFDHLQAGFLAGNVPPLFAHMRWIKGTGDLPLSEDYWELL